MTHFIGIATCVTALLAPCAAGAATLAELGIDPDAAYSATRTVIADGQVMRFKEYRSGESMRLELNSQGSESIMIAAGGKAYSILPGMSTYLEVDLEDVIGRTGLNQEAALADIEEIGTETVNGEPATRLRARHAEQGNEGEGDFWVSDDGVLVKMDMQVRDGRGRVTNVRSELSEIAMGDQDPALFTVPAGYTGVNAGGLLRSFTRPAGAGRTPPPAASPAANDAHDVDDGEPSTGEPTAEPEAQSAVQQTTRALKDGFRKLIRKSPEQ